VTRAQERSKGRGAVDKAIRHGVLAHRPAACEACGVAGRLGNVDRWTIVWHHHAVDPYAPENLLQVTAVCESCHRRIHSGRIPEPRTGRVHARPEPRCSLLVGQIGTRFTFRVVAAGAPRQRCTEARWAWMSEYVARGGGIAGLPLQWRSIDAGRLAPVP
jgi:hypothetical protein